MTEHNFHLIDARREAQDQYQLLGSVNMEAPLAEAWLQLRFLFWTFGCAVQEEDVTFAHPEPPFNRLFIFFGSDGEVKMDGKVYRLKSGVFYLLPEGCPFVASYFAGGELLYIHFSAMDQALHRIFSGQRQVFSLESPRLAALCAELRHSGWGGELQSLMLNVIWRMVDNGIRRELAVRAGLVRQFGNIFQLLDNTPPARVRIAELAEAAGMTPGALARKFQRNFGLTMKEFIDGRTMQEARQLLMRSSDPITVIAVRLGFSDPHYFYHFFHKRAGCTPQEFRQRRQ